LPEKDSNQEYMIQSLLSLAMYRESVFAKARAYSSKTT
jgi:hypothetical protein